MDSPAERSFAALLRRYRQAAGLTQEELAERAHMSMQAVGALERGDRRLPRKDTVDLLASALELALEERAAFAEAARPRGGAALSQPDVSPVSDTEGYIQATGARAQPLLEPPALPDSSAPPAVEAPNAPEPLALVREAQASLHALADHLPYWSAALTTAAQPHIARLTHLSKKPYWRAMSALMLVAIALSAIFLKGEVSGAPLGALCGGALAIATDFPTGMGAESAAGIAVQDAANLAISRNRDLGGGYTLKAINYDDVSPANGLHDPATGARNVERMVKNQCIIGMVGPTHSDVALAEAPIATRDGLVMISPENTFPELTLRSYAEAQGINFDALHPPNKPNTYFRIVLNDSVQAIVDANVAFDLGEKSVFVVSNLDRYGELLVSEFTLAFEEKGGTVVGSASLGYDSTDLSVVTDIAKQIEAANPDAVYYGGWTSSGISTLKALLVNQGYAHPLISDDGIVNDPAYIWQAGVSAANDTYASVAGRDISTFTSSAAARLLSDYHARYPDESLTGDVPYSDDAAMIPYGYDAAMVLITALKQIMAEGRPVTRAALAAAVQNIQYDGVTGPISFDGNGDVTHGSFSIYVVRQGQWVYAWQVNM